MPPVRVTRDARPAKAATGTKDCATSETAPAVCTSAAYFATDDRSDDDDDDPVAAGEASSPAALASAASLTDPGASVNDVAPTPTSPPSGARREPPQASRTRRRPARCCAARPGFGRPARTFSTSTSRPVAALSAAATRTICPPPSRSEPSTATGASADAMGVRDAELARRTE